MSQAIKAKLQMSAANAAADNLLKEIETSQPTDPWHWAHNEAVLKPLRAAKEALGAVTDSFARTWLSTDVAPMKKFFGAEELSVAWGRFVSTTTPHVTLLQGETNQLIRMHQARNAK